MCGIFGAVVGDGSALSTDRLPGYVRSLFELSESRGKEAAGLALADRSEIVVYKRPVPASEFTSTREFKTLIENRLGKSVAFIGHSRLVTDGSREMNVNNQPVKSHGIVGIHNGIIVNHEALWRANPELERHGSIDSEVIFAILAKHLAAGLGFEAATAKTFAALDGAASIACLFADRDALLLATNNGSLYYSAGGNGAGLIFSSEEYILRQFLKKSGLGGELPAISALGPGEAVLARLSPFEAHPFSFDPSGGVATEVLPRSRAIVDQSPPLAASSAHVRRSSFIDFDAIATKYAHEPSSLRRCSRCILPESMPFIRFDEAGVCNFCRAYRANDLHGEGALERLVTPRRKKSGHDCVVALSGGRDSVFGLHYIKKVLGMRPVAYTYDWGMVTDLARRNASRICGRLGVEHILVSADIQKKRRNIRRNVEAWLDSPALGAVPLFMAGDKAYFHFLGKVCEQVGTDLSFLCENLLERSDFKVGFAGVSPEVVDEDHTYTLGIASKAKLLGYYARQFATNRGYINGSLLDSAKAFAFFYVRKRTDENLFRYIPWVEEDLVATIRNEYDFELAPDTPSTWRIGDGTAAFYNYIYYVIGGLTENDTFRSNQIRAGAIDRERALLLVAEENKPRFPSIAWYLDTVGVSPSLDEVLSVINRAPKQFAASR